MVCDRRWLGCWRHQELRPPLVGLTAFLVQVSPRSYPIPEPPASSRLLAVKGETFLWSWLWPSLYRKISWWNVLPLYASYQISLSMEPWIQVAEGGPGCFPIEELNSPLPFFPAPASWWLCFEDTLGKPRLAGYLVKTHGSLRKKWNGMIGQALNGYRDRKRRAGGCSCSSLAREASWAPPSSWAWFLGLQCIY